MELDPVLRDLTAPYILSVIAELEQKQHHLYSLLLRASEKTFSVNLVYYYRTEPARQDSTGDPIQIYTVREFLNLAATFHENDCFTIGLEQGSIVIGTESEFDVEVVQCLFTEWFRQHCRLSLFANKILNVGEMEGISRKIWSPSINSSTP